MFMVYGIKFQFATGYGGKKSARCFSLKLHDHVTEEKQCAATRKWEKVRTRKGKSNLLERIEDVNVGDEK